MFLIYIGKKAREYWSSGSLIKGLIASPYVLLLTLMKKPINSISRLIYFGNNIYYLQLYKCGSSTIQNQIVKKMGAVIYHDNKFVKKDAKIFTFVRNPYSRVLSAYLDKVKNMADSNSYQFLNSLNKISGKELSFKEFVELTCNTPDWETDPHLMSYNYIINQTASGRDILIGKIEDFNKHWYALSEFLGFPLGNIEIKNKSNGKKELDNYYTAKLKKMVYDRYKLDFERYGYEK